MAVYHAIVRGNFVQIDTRNKQLEIYEDRESAEKKHIDPDMEIVKVIIEKYDDSNICPKCEESNLLELPSMNLKICTNGKCGAIYDWKLKEGQKSVLIENLIG